MKSKLPRMLITLILIYLAVCALAAIFQRSLMYFPYRETEPDMLTQAGEVGCAPWRDPAGNVIGWKNARDGAKGANRLIVFHGNAGYALHRVPYIEGFERIDDGRTWEVLLFEYPGYGARPGRMGEEAFIQAASRAIDALAAADARPIYLLGESLGSGVASALAKRRPESIKGLLLVTPYASMTDVAAKAFWFLPVRLIIRDRWDNVAALQDYRGPLATLLAGEDEVVTAAQGHVLYDSYRGPKRLWTQRGATHNTLDLDPDSQWWSEVSEFLLSPPSQ
jgi:pimeloyl-ACP methyl ester carboxylesterase